MLPWNVVNFLAIVGLLILGIIAIVSIFMDNGFEEGFYAMVSLPFLILALLSVICYSKFSIIYLDFSISNFFNFSNFCLLLAGYEIFPSRIEKGRAALWY